MEFVTIPPNSGERRFGQENTLDDTLTRPWLSARGAALRIGCKIYEVHRLAMIGRIRTKAEPGTWVKFNAEDVEAIRSERSDESA